MSLLWIPVPALPIVDEPQYSSVRLRVEKPSGIKDPGLTKPGQACIPVLSKRSDEGWRQFAHGTLSEEEVKGQSLMYRNKQNVLITVLTGPWLCCNYGGIRGLHSLSNGCRFPA